MKNINFRNRKLVITIRTILGLMFLLSGVSGFIAGRTMQGVPPEMVPYLQALWGMGIVQMIKTTEIVSGLMLAVGILPALAVLFVAPLCIGIIVFNSVVAPMYVISGIVVSALTAFLGYAYWDKYRVLFEK